MSEKALQPEFPPDESYLDPGDTNPTQEYLALRDQARSLERTSQFSAQRAAEMLVGTGQQYMYALPDEEGVLVLRQYDGRAANAEARIMQGGEQYQQTLDYIAAHGYLDDAQREAYRNTFATLAAERHFPRASQSGARLSKPVSMVIGSIAHASEALQTTATDLGLDADSEAQLAALSSEMQALTDHPYEGANFLYQYSPPFIEVGMLNDTVAARLGTLLMHKNDGAGMDTMQFYGITIPTNAAIELLKQRMAPFAEEADASRAYALTVPSAAELTSELIRIRHDRLLAFTDQLKRFAPEAAALDDRALLLLVKHTAEYPYAHLLRHPDVTPVEMHLIQVMLAKDAAFTMATKRSNPEEAATDVSDLPHFWEPQSRLTANGRTGLVTRTDYEDSPSHPGTRGRKLGQEVYGPEKSAQLRQRMFEVKTQ